MLMKRALVIFGCTLLGAVSSFANLTPVIDFTSGNYAAHGGDISGQYQVVGWAFTPTVTIQVTSLDWYAPTSGSATASSAVTIWQASNGSVVLDANVTGNYADNYFETPVGPGHLLTAGTTYIIGAVIAPDTGIIDNATGITVSPLITYQGDEYGGYSQTPNLVMPANPFSPQDPGYFGPNFSAT